MAKSTYPGDYEASVDSGKYELSRKSKKKAAAAQLKTKAQKLLGLASGYSKAYDAGEKAYKKTLADLKLKIDEILQKEADLKKETDKKKKKTLESEIKALEKACDPIKKQLSDRFIAWQLTLADLHAAAVDVQNGVQMLEDAQ